jgi:hypothetical protein
MSDIPYTKGSISALYHETFDQLVAAFPEYEVWERHENFDRWLSVGVVNRSTGAAAVASLVGQHRRRPELLSRDDLVQIRDHLQSASKDDLSL